MVFLLPFSAPRVDHHTVNFGSSRDAQGPKGVSRRTARWRRETPASEVVALPLDALDRGGHHAVLTERRCARHDHPVAGQQTRVAAEIGLRQIDRDG